MCVVGCVFEVQNLALYIHGKYILPPSENNVHVASYTCTKLHSVALDKAYHMVHVCSDKGSVRAKNWSINYDK